MRDENSRLRTAVNKRDREIAVKMISRGDSFADIADILGLSIDEVQKLKI